MLAKFVAPEKKTQILVQDVQLADVKQDEKKPEPPPPPPPKQEPPKVEITKFTPPKIVKDEEVKPEEKPPETEKLEDTKIGTINQEGEKTDVVAPLLSRVPDRLKPRKHRRKITIRNSKRYRSKLSSPVDLLHGLNTWKETLIVTHLLITERLRATILLLFPFSLTRMATFLKCKPLMIPVTALPKKQCV